MRVRQHVNPLSQKYQQPVEPPDWEKVYAQAGRSLHLDIGCGRGWFLLQMAELHPEWNFLGLEIREPLVEQANRWRDERGLTNLHYVFCNVSNSLEPLLRSLPPTTLQRVTIQFPDPWFKKRHQKRRVVQPETVAELAEYLPVGGVLFVQSDVEAVAVEMCDRVQDHPAFHRQNNSQDNGQNNGQSQSSNSSSWLSTNPLPVPTEREQSTLSRGEPVYRAVFLRQELT